MKTTFIFSILFFLLLSATSFCRLKGTWRQVFPEENGEIPGPRYQHYMSPIGDGQVLMIGGSGGGYPHYYNETWLYSYESNTWRKVECDNTPNTYYLVGYPGECMSQIADNMVLTIGFIDETPTHVVSKPWLFYIDSLKWYRLHDSVAFSRLYVENNLGFNYFIEHDINGNRYGLSSLTHVNLNEPLTSPNLLVQESINEENVTKQGPYHNYPKLISDTDFELQFVLNNTKNGKHITWIPAGWIGGQPQPQFMNIEREIRNWLFLEQGQDTLPRGYNRKYSQLTHNATLMHYPGRIGNPLSLFYIIEYSPETNQMSTYKIDPPGNGIYNCKMAQIKDGVVMLFGGMLPTGLSNETWIFELDHLDVVDNTGENVNIYILDDNLYMLDSDLKDAVLYNILGQKVVAVTGDKLDLNPLPIGVYFLQYNEKGAAKTAKVVRK